MTVARLFDHPGLLAKAIAEATDDIIFAKDLEGRYRFANPATLGVFGLAPEEVIGRTDVEILGEDVARRLQATDRQVLATGQPTEMEEPVRRRDGSMRIFQTRKLALRGEDGSVVGVLGIARDITERKAADQQRAAAQVKLEMGIQAAGLVMADIDYRTNLNHISAELARMLELGDGPLTVPRQVIFDSIHPDDRARYVDAIKRTLDPAGDGRLAIDVRALLPSGAVRWLHIRLQILFEQVAGQRVPVRGICAARDVTPERVRERQLQAAQRLTQSVIEGAGALVYAKDLQGRYILSNQAWRAMHALTPEQAQDMTDEQLFGAEKAEELRVNDRRVVETGEPVTAQVRMTIEGRAAIVRSTKFPLYDENGQIYAICGVSTDITDVVEADRRKDEFIATLAHELRNPLAPIRTGLEILRRVGQLPPTAERTRTMMERQLTHLVRLVDDLLDVSRVSRGKVELRIRDITLEHVLNDALEACQPAITAAGHALAMELPHEPVHLRGDLTRLAQVFSNLVSNAAKYTPPGGRIIVRAHCEPPEVVVEVEDNGRGIAHDMLGRVFDLFTQGRDSTQPSESGLGIGLWLVRRLVELHHGSIAAQSPGAGLGSTFVVRLPMAP
jgi:PAS domain S-box-containing protein